MVCKLDFELWRKSSSRKKCSEGKIWVIVQMDQPLAFIPLGTRVYSACREGFLTLRGTGEGALGAGTAQHEAGAPDHHPSHSACSVLGRAVCTRRHCCPGRSWSKLPRDRWDKKSVLLPLNSSMENQGASDLNRTATGAAASPTVGLHVQKGSQQADQAPPSTILTLLVSPF